MNIAMTSHAKIRLQQRGIPRQVLAYLVAFGKAMYDHQGARVLYLNKKSREQIRRVAGDDVFRALASALDVYAVMSVGGTVVTVGHRTQRINRN